MVTKPKRMQQLIDTTANWERTNPILSEGEIGIEKCTNGEKKIKVGDGMTAWKNLKHVSKTVEEIEKAIQSTEKAIQSAETGLQNQIDNIVITASDSGDVTAEVAQARVDFDGNGHNTLKARLDADFNDLQNQITTANTEIGGVKEDLSDLTNIEVIWRENTYIGHDGLYKTYTGTVSRSYWTSEKIFIRGLWKLNFEYFLRYAFYDETSKPIYISDELNGSENVTIEIPDGAFYFAFTKETSLNPNIDYFVNGFMSATHQIENYTIANELNNKVYSLENDFNNAIKKNVNLFDKSKVTDGYWTGSGVINPENIGGASTDYISVKEGDVVHFTQFSIFSTMLKGACFNRSKEFVGMISTVYCPDITINGKEFYFTVPSGVSYVVLSLLKKDIDKVMLTINNDYPSEYIPYGYSLTDKVNVEIDKGENDYSYLIQSFRTIGVVGDSLASGEVCSNNSASTNHDMYEHSWLQYIARFYGFTGINFSRGGLSTTTWLTSKYGLSLAQADENKCQCYIIGLGANDMKYDIDTHLGTSADVGTDANTFYGNYSRIISELKAIQPKAKFFVITMSWLYTENSTYADYCRQINEAIRYIAENTDNCYLIDLEDDELYYTQDVQDNMRSGHYNAIGYNMMGMHLAKIIGNYMYEHQDEFRQVEFIGTEWEWN